MPRVGSKQSIVWTPPATQRAIVTFCWLPPDSRRTSPCARASIWSRLDGAVDLLPLAARSIRPHRREPGRERQRDVLAHRALHQQGLGAIRRHVDEAGPDRVGRMMEARRACRRRAARRRPGARSRRGCRTARPAPGPRAPRRRAPRPGSRSNDTSCSFVPGAEARGPQSRGVASGGRAPAAVRSAPRPAASLDDLAEHQLDDPVLGALRSRRRRRPSRPRAGRWRGRRPRRSRSGGGR